MKASHGRITLRRGEPEDAEVVQAWRAQPSTERFRPTEQHNLEIQRTILAARRTAVLSANTDRKVMWLVLYDDIPAGCVTLDMTSRQRKLASVGYLVDEAFLGKRVASRGWVG